MYSTFRSENDIRFSSSSPLNSWLNFLTFRRSPVTSKPGRLAGLWWTVVSVFLARSLTSCHSKAMMSPVHLASLNCISRVVLLFSKKSCSEGVGWKERADGAETHTVQKKGNRYMAKRRHEWRDLYIDQDAWHQRVLCKTSAMKRVILRELYTECY